LCFVLEYDVLYNKNFNSIHKHLRNLHSFPTRRSSDLGETLTEQEAGQTLAVIQRQLVPVLALGKDAVSNIVVAYEPVWAIGTGRTATPAQAQEVHAAIRASLTSLDAHHVRVLYGGSVKADNAASLFAMPDIDGALVGGASLVADELLRIATA